METELMCDYSCFFFLLSSASLSHPFFLPPFLYFLHSFISCFSCVFWLLDLSLRVLHSFLLSPLSSPATSSLSVSVSLSLRLQWVWLRGECGVPRLSLAIKAMPTPRLHMSSRPSKRGGVLLIRSVSRNTNTPPSSTPNVHLSGARFGCSPAVLAAIVCLCHWQKEKMLNITSLRLIFKMYLEYKGMQINSLSKCILLLYSLKQRCALVPVTSEYTLRSWRQNYWISLEQKYFMIEYERCGLAVLDIFFFLHCACQSHCGSLSFNVIIFCCWCDWFEQFMSQRES